MIELVLRYAGWLVAGVFLLYLAARVVFAAYFRTKQEHEATLTTKKETYEQQRPRPR